MRRLVLFASLLVLAALLAAPARAGTPMGTHRVVSGLDSPVYAASPPGDPRLFIVLRGGKVVIWDGQQVLDPPFLDIHGKVDTDGEGGLLSIAFPLDFATTRAFYVYYTTQGPDQNTPLRSRISRFRASASDPNVADPTPTAANEKVLLSVDQPFTNHNGGTVAFGPDGYLYMGFGDGGDAGDPGDRAQNTGNLLGKMLRLDVSFSSFNDGYDVPPDNPFVGAGNPKDEIWAIGMRNPFRYSFDRLTGDLYIGDVGQNRIEEIDVEPAGIAGGRNYGWNVMEGTECFDHDPGEPPCNDPSLTLPVYEYEHDGGCNAVTGGVVYRGSAASLDGQYLFAEECDGRIWSLTWNGAGGITGPVVSRDGDLAPDQGSIDNPVAFAEDADGNVYIVDPDGGELFEIVPEPGQTLLVAAGAAVLALRARRGRSDGARRPA